MLTSKDHQLTCLTNSSVVRVSITYSKAFGGLDMQYFSFVILTVDLLFT